VSRPSRAAACSPGGSAVGGHNDAPRPLLSRVLGRALSLATVFCQVPSNIRNTSAANKGFSAGRWLIHTPLPRPFLETVTLRTTEGGALGYEHASHPFASRGRGSAEIAPRRNCRRQLVLALLAPPGEGLRRLPVRARASGTCGPRCCSARRSGSGRPSARGACQQTRGRTARWRFAVKRHRRQLVPRGCLRVVELKFRCVMLCWPTGTSVLSPPETPSSRSAPALDRHQAAAPTAGASRCGLRPTCGSVSRREGRVDGAELAAGDRERLVGAGQVRQPPDSR